jgi:hypothetical protein
VHELYSVRCLKERDCILYGFKRDNIDNLPYPYTNITKRLYTGGGTSSMFAVENLRAMGYKELWLYGVDMHTEPYLDHRGCWNNLLKDAELNGCKIINKGPYWQPMGHRN